MIKLSKSDHQSLSFAICVLKELADNTADVKHAEVIRSHAKRIRKVQLIVVAGLTQKLLTFTEFLQSGVPENNPIHHGLTVLLNP